MASIRSTGALTNTGGTMMANAQDLTLSAGGQLDNTGGQIGHAGSGTFTLSSADTDNTRGNILSNAALTFTAIGNVNNSSGLVAAQSLSASATGWNNGQGKLVTTQSDLSLHTTQSAVTNSAGLIQSTQDLRLTAEGASNALHNNLGKIVAARDATLSAGPLTNQGGLIAAGRQLGITSSGALNNAASNNTAANNSSGLIYSGADLTLQATNVDNTASQILAVGNASLATGSGSLTNTAGLVRVGQTLAVQAASVDNTATRAFNSDGSPKATGLEGNSIAITTASLSNTQGAIRAAQDLSIYSDGQINNQQGELSAGRNLQIDTWQASAPSLSISNQAGQIVADRSVNVRTGTLSGAGTIASQGDVSLSLQGDHTLAGTLQAAGNLSLSTTGQITNPISVQAGQNLSVSANKLDNQATGELLSDRTTSLSIADTLTNRGLIDGADTRIQAGNVNNLGTGRIYGDRVAIAAATLSNQEESTAGASTAITTAATIAGRQQVDLGVQTLTNQENALLYSGGDMAVGGALNANWQATGTAQTINNNSATIEAAQNLSIQAASIRNTNEHFASQVQQTSQTAITEYQHQTGDVYRVNDTSTRFAASEVSVTNCEVTCLETSAGKSDAFIQYDYTRTVNESVVTQSAPGKILAGGGITLTASNVLNDKSQIVAGGTLNVQAASLNNVQGAGTQTTTDAGTATSYWRNRQKGTDSTGTSTAAYTPAAVEQTITLSANRYEQGTANASTNTAPTASTLSTVQAQASGTGALAAGPGLSTVAGTRANTATGTTTPGNTAGQSGSAQTQVRTLQPGSKIPNTSLYKTHPESGAHYLVETDPRFANYKTWLGSDYMLSALQIDPATAQKRLGDGFYEQKLIREQVLALTGNRYLGNYTSDEQEYMALMNSGLTYAKQFNLRPGIALTPDQVAQLTSDMVWLVSQEVTLADGTKQSVLVPQVYVRVKPGDLDGSGSLLAGADVNLTLSGDLSNSGTIAGRNALKVSADNIRNLAGTISGDSVTLSAKQDIDNIGGLIQGVSAAVATAGRDLNLTTTTQSSTNNAGANRFAQTGIDRVAGLYVSGSAGVLVASAGRDLNLTAAQIGNAGTGATVLAAGNNLNLSTVTTSSSQDINWSSKNYLRQSQNKTATATTKA